VAGKATQKSMAEAQARQDVQRGAAELAAARRQSRALIWSAAVFSVFVNLLMLTGPLFMLQVYDRVLGSGSEETLLALVVLVVFLFAIMGLLDYARGRVMGRVAARLRAALDGRVFAAVLRRAALVPDTAAMPRPGSLRDLEAVQRLVGSPVLLSLFDMPWTPLFLLGIFIFHPLLGALAVAGGLVLVANTFLNQALTRSPARTAQAAAEAADRAAEGLRVEAETVRSLGMQRAAFARWERLRAGALEAATEAGDRAGAFSAATRALRLLLQSAMLGLGAWLVLQGQLTAGAMVAASILLGRALAPVEQAIAQWEVVRQGAAGWQALGQLLNQVPEEPRRTQLPRPAARLEVEGLTLVPPGQKQAALRMVSFNLAPGLALGVIGPSGAGKSSLARALTGIWRPAAGRVRLDGIALDQYEPDTLGRLIGYLPQRVSLFDGTIAENISRLDPEADDAAIVDAARRADAHKMIVEFPEGYDTRITATGGRLSGGQIQRIGLARALYGDPVLLVLDEPNSNLDNEGSMALNEAIRTFKSDGKAVLIMAHRPAAIRECDQLLLLEGGLRRAYGPRDQVLRETVANHAQLRRSGATGGVT
jgi:PrtD family type I secretion system ABC transporter